MIKFKKIMIKFKKIKVHKIQINQIQKKVIYFILLD